MFVPFPDGRHLFFYADAARTIGSIARLSAARRRGVPPLRRVHHRASRASSAGSCCRRRRRSASSQAAFAGPDAADMLQCALFASVDEYLSRFFESDYLKGPLAYGGLSGSAAGPRTPGTAFSKFYHSATGLGDALGTWALVQGGMGSVTARPSAAASAARRRDRLRPRGRGDPVPRTTVRRRRPRRTAANAAATSCCPTPTRSARCWDWSPRKRCPGGVAERVGRIRMEGTGFKINFALSELPDFVAMPGHGGGAPAHGRHHDRAVHRLSGARVGRGEVRPAVKPALQPDVHPVGHRPDPRARGRPHAVHVGSSLPVPAPRGRHRRRADPPAASG